MRPGRLIRAAIVFKPSTLLRLHRALTQRKYRRLFSSTGQTKPGPKGPSQDVIAAVVAMKQRNPTWGCPRIAQQIALAFAIPITKDVVRRILAALYQPTSRPDSTSPSWLTALGHAKTVCGVSTCFDANRPSCARTGCSSCWTIVPVASWAVACTGATWMASHYVGCSIALLEANPRPIPSARIMILCIGSSNGKPICESLR